MWPLFLLITLWGVFPSCFCPGTCGTFPFFCLACLSRVAFWRLFMAGVFLLPAAVLAPCLHFGGGSFCLPLSRTSFGASLGIRSCPWPPGPGLLACFLLFYRLELVLGIICKSLFLTRASVFPCVHTFPLPGLSLLVFLAFHVVLYTCGIGCPLACVVDRSSIPSVVSPVV